MGNTICGQQNKQIGFTSDNPQEILTHKQNSLSPKIKQFLQKQKPYKKQFEDKTLVLKKLGQNFYQGEVSTFGKPHGIGKLYRSDGSLYVGKFIKGQAHGMGYLIFPNGDFYEGNFVKDLPDDPRGKLVSKQSAYLGGYKSNLLHGDGQFVSELVHFKGQFRNGKMYKGNLKWKKQKKGFQNEYNGLFDQNQKFSGQGSLKIAQGFYTGQFLDGKKHGFGKFVYKNGYIYEGKYCNDIKQGAGVLNNSNSRIKYEGQWRNNLPHGNGKQYDKNGNITDGQFINGISSHLTQT